MGALRLFLACVVIVAHTSASGLLPFIGGKHAVRIFFVISGFYMAMILSEKYNEGDRRKWLFYSNRALRIFPPFWIVLTLEVIASLTFYSMGMAPADSPWMPAFQFLVDHGKWDLVSAYVVSQVSAIGVDVMFLFNITKEAALEFYHGPAGPGEFRGWKPYPMGHMWTISCELLFYAMAPFLNRLRSHWLVGLWLITMGMGFTSYYWLPGNVASVSSDFLSLMQMGYFLGGMVAYHVLRPRMEFLPPSVQLALVVPLVVLMLAFTPASSISYTGSELMLYFLTILALPALFSRSSKLGWDRWLGNLSYPVYLVHVSVIRIGDQLGLKKALVTTTQGHLLFTAICTVVSITLAAALASLVENRLDRWRQRRVPHSI
ncbi:acyltransferase [Verrucomicrobium sp. BvORR106]|uniref:acyltransferase family protein n=1 Tax=Verrucomicrobium sp. BvORR106 TaxID=1403819 RepID=UPI0005712BE5|nr:acyltransferase [Verrucomicrobium sp. BvORR106]